MDCLFCYKVFLKEKEFVNYNPNPEVKKAIFELFEISGKPDVQGLSEDLVICVGCHRKLDDVVEWVEQLKKLKELQRKVDGAKIDFKQGMMDSKEISQAVAKNFDNRMSPSSLDRLILLKAIEGQDAGAGDLLQKKDKCDDLASDFWNLDQTNDGSDSDDWIELEHENQKATKVYFANIPESYTKKKIKELFKQFGAILSSKIIFENGKSRGDGYVIFDDPKSAEVAVKRMNGKELEGKNILISASINKNERYMERKKEYARKLERYEAIKKDQMSRHQRAWNLEDTSDDEQLGKEFQSSGTITPPKVTGEKSRRMSTPSSRSYESPKSVAEMRRFAGKPRKKPHHMPLAHRDNYEEFLTSPNIQRVVNMSNIRSPPFSPFYSPTGSNSSMKQPMGDQMSSTPPQASPHTQGFGIQPSFPSARVSNSAPTSRPNDQKQMLKLFPLIYEQCRNFVISGKVAEILLKEHADILHFIKEFDHDALDPLIEEALGVIHKEESKAPA